MPAIPDELELGEQAARVAILYLDPQLFGNAHGAALLCLCLYRLDICRHRACPCPFANGLFISANAMIFSMPANKATEPNSLDGSLPPP
jgi:hypothetical protein